MKILFIISPARTGTTLIKGCLGTHPQILAPYELHLMRPLMDLVLGEGLNSWQHIREANSPALDRSVRRFAWDLYDSIATSYEPDPQTGYRYKAIIDKSLGYNIPIVPDIIRVLNPTGWRGNPPYGLYLLFLYRNPLDVIASHVRRKKVNLWGELADKSDQEVIETVSKRIRVWYQMMRDWSKQFPTFSWDLYYEQFVKNPDSHCQHIWFWMGLNSFSLPTDYQEIKRGAIKKEGLDEDDFLKARAIHTDRVGTWPDVISTDQASRIRTLFRGVYQV